jgi:hypothetical protein
MTFIGMGSDNRIVSGTLSQATFGWSRVEVTAVHWWNDHSGLPQGA